MRRKIKVLVVDASQIFRELLARGIGSDDDLEVVSTAENPYEARDKIIEYQPDVMTLNLDLPRMSGIEFLKKLMPQYPFPVVIISSENEKILDALKAGAVDYMIEPRIKHGKNLEQFFLELNLKIKIASTANMSKWKSKPVTNIQLIAIGASTGGTEAIASILAKLPNDLPGIVIVQHMPPVFTKLYAERLDALCSMEVKEAQSGDLILPGKVLIAQGDYHMRVNKMGTELFVECLKGNKVNGHCPSVDVLFESVAEHVGKGSLGVILTGMGHDGAKGLLNMRRKGAITIGQDEGSSIVYGMPKTAFNMGGVIKQVGLEDMAYTINSIAKIH